MRPEWVVRTSGAQPGDSVILTKGIAIEGTAILAREVPDQLLVAGIVPDVLERVSNYLFNPGISVVREALISHDAVSVHCMHDPTEGGLATGLREISLAAGVGLEIEADHIPILPECLAVCDTLGLDPLGLLASGSLLITLAEKDSSALVRTLSEHGIQARIIGRVTSNAEGLRLRTADGIRDLPSFTRDELARYLSQNA